MKRSIPFLILLLFSFICFSQETVPETDSNGSANVAEEETQLGGLQGTKFGVRGGFTISNLDFEEQPPAINKHRNSIFIGFLASFGLSRSFAVIPELQFSAEGANDEKWHLDYIQLPVMLQIRLSEKIKIGLGPQVGLNIPKVDDNLTDIAYSGVAGIEYKINYVFFADLRYNYGFTNIFDSDYGITAKNRTVQLGIGYKF